ncbi:MAG: hypothetical protein OEY20_07255 [Gemmatimonadota bacterium]|nr:hypothetical protein [Gemmatimonadota bacterium]MDH5197032.1 hypothetical protein [Gemmatimonadota bacterium]
MLELLAGVVVAVAALALVLEPLVRQPGVEGLGVPDDFDATPLEESESPKVQALLALKEIEFDRATGKLSDEDYAQLKSRYGRDALAAMETEAQQSAVVAGADDPAEALIQAVRQDLQVCPACGPRPETGATFCSECGRPLAVPVS